MSAPAGRFRIASFNLESLGSERGAGPLSERLPLLRPQLQRLRADVLLLQEVDAQRRPAAQGGGRGLLALERLIEGTDYADFHHAVSLDRSGRHLSDRHNLVVLSRWPLDSWESLWHRLVPPPRLRMATASPPPQEAQEVAWDRPLLRVSLRLPNGRLLHLLNLHLRAPLAVPVPGQGAAGNWASVGGWAEGFYLAGLKRGGQALEARLVVDRLLDQDPDALVAVAGDMNATEDEVPLRILRGAADDVHSASLAGRELMALAQAVPADRRFTVLHDGRPALYDHLLVSAGLGGLFRHCEIHNEGLHDEGAVPAGSPQSFHAPIAAEFLLV